MPSMLAIVKQFVSINDALHDALYKNFLLKYNLIYWFQHIKDSFISIFTMICLERGLLGILSTWAWSSLHIIDLSECCRVACSCTGTFENHFYFFDTASNTGITGCDVIAGQYIWCRVTSVALDATSSCTDGICECNCVTDGHRNIPNSANLCTTGILSRDIIINNWNCLTSRNGS